MSMRASTGAFPLVKNVFLGECPLRPLNPYLSILVQRWIKGIEAKLKTSFPYDGQYNHPHTVYRIRLRCASTLNM
jgi:hypothetical protein